MRGYQQQLTLRPVLTLTENTHYIGKLLIRTAWLMSSCLLPMSWHLMFFADVPGPVSITVFPSQFKFDRNFVSLSPRLEYRDSYNILYMARQLCCRGMCKTLLRSNGQLRSYGKAKFPSYLNCGQKNVSERNRKIGNSWFLCYWQISLLTTTPL